MNQKKLSPGEELAGIMKRIYDRGMTSTSGGNLSIKDEAGNIWITPSGVDKGTLKPEDVIFVSPNGKVHGKHKPSIELPFHKMIYEGNKDVKAILHAHPAALVAYSLIHRVPETKALASLYYGCGNTGIAPYALPGSDKLGELISGILKQGIHSIIMENHAMVLAAASLEEAFVVMEYLEFCAALMIRSARIGEPFLLSEGQLQTAGGEFALEAGLKTGVLKIGHNLENMRSTAEELITIVRRSYVQRILSTNFGSFSCRVSGGFLITPPEGNKRELAPEDLLFVPSEEVAAGDLSPAIQLHLGIYRKEPEINAVIIAQPLNMMAFSVTRRTFDTTILPESFMMLRELGYSSFESFYTGQESICEKLSLSAPALQIEGHSFLVAGKTLLKAFDSLEVAELSAGSVIDTFHLGAYGKISAEGITDLRDAFGLY